MKILNTPEVAEYLNITRSQVVKWAKKRKIRPISKVKLLWRTIYLPKGRLYFNEKELRNVAEAHQNRREGL